MDADAEADADVDTLPVVLSEDAAEPCARRGTRSVVFPGRFSEDQVSGDEELTELVECVCVT
jgi:hypothetical protein